MTIPLSDDVFKRIVPRGFDDPWEQQQHLAQQFLGQLAPRTPDGGRQVLWCCPACDHFWIEHTTLKAGMSLSAEQLTVLAFHLGINRLDQLPLALCPTCAHRELGGRLRVEEGIGNMSFYRFVWRAATNETVQILQLVIMDARQLAQACAHRDLSAPHQFMARWPTDLLLSRPHLQFLVHMISDVTLPESEEIYPFDAMALEVESERVSLPGGDCYVRGYFLRPGRRHLLLEEPEDDVLFAVIEGSRRAEACDPHALFAWWQRLLVRYRTWV